MVPVLLIDKVPLFMLLEDIVHPPIFPLVAVTSPEKEPVAALSVPLKYALPSVSIRNCGDLIAHRNSV